MNDWITDGRIGWMDKSIDRYTDMHELANDNNSNKPREYIETQPSGDNIPENYLDKNTAGISYLLLSVRRKEETPL